MKRSAKEAIADVWSKKTDEEWLAYRDELIELLNDKSLSDEDRFKIAPLGCLEVAAMVCDGIERKKAHNEKRMEIYYDD